MHIPPHQNDDSHLPVLMLLVQSNAWHVHAVSTNYCIYVQESGVGDCNTGAECNTHDTGAV